MKKINRKPYGVNPKIKFLDDTFETELHLKIFITIIVYLRFNLDENFLLSLTVILTDKLNEGGRN